MSPEDALQKLKMDCQQLCALWARVADHVKQAPLPRKIIHDLRKELQAVLDKNR